MNYLEKFSLKGKTACIFGGTGLIGTEFSRAMADAGAKTIILDVNEEKGKELAEKWCAEGLDVSFERYDTTGTESFEEETKQLYEQHGDIHIMINASYPRTKDWGNKLEMVAPESWRTNVDTQMNDPCLLSAKFAERMKERGIKGSIINIGSTYGVVGPDFRIYDGTPMTCPAAYAAIKGGIINFTRYLASYYGTYGIRVNVLCPGGIADNQNPDFVKEYERRTPLSRMGNPSDLGGPALFLASDAASYVTGAVIMADGGWTSI